jgi:hypothetical protein
MIVRQGWLLHQDAAFCALKGGLVTADGGSSKSNSFLTSNPNFDN